MMLLTFALFTIIPATQLWCHQGGLKDYSPAQCSDHTMECFKFVCSNGNSDFIARGCGVDYVKNSVGLKNQSCFQAQSACELVGGTSHCYTCSDKVMCNESYKLSQNINLLIILCIIGLIVIH
uniref:UPAR/Ly6 domain-containing protein n=1 Tax=Rhabditophanes sp. KR3021 TaxID=114890 RepID=A0AC35U4J0_9BILA